MRSGRPAHVWRRLRGACSLQQQLFRPLTSTAESVLASLRDFERTGVPDGAGAVGAADGFDLARMHRLLEDLGNPHETLKAVHVAGSKGKGSVAAMLSAILTESGYKAGMFTSPHIARLRERICIGSKPVTQEALDRLFSHHSATLMLANRRERGELSTFEAVTGLALCHFAEQKVDAAVVEVGLGGSLDATNVFSRESLQVAVITAIGLEHQRVLDWAASCADIIDTIQEAAGMSSGECAGDSIDEITAAKAGICKRGRPVVIGAQPEPEALGCLLKHAESHGASAIQAEEVIAVRAGDVERDESGARQAFQLQYLDGGQDEAQPQEIRSRLLGRHQANNAATAAAAALELRRQGWSHITRDTIAGGLESASLPGRFEVLRLGEGKPWVVLDGAHTPASAEALVETLDRVFGAESLAIVVAMAADKDHQGFLAAVRRARPGVIVFTSALIAGASDRSAPPGMLAAHWQAGSFSEVKPLRSRELMKVNMASALEACQRELFAAPGDGVICVTGSLHAVGAATKALNIERP